MEKLSDSTFRYDHQVQFVDTDMAGIVHFSNFFRYMEAAEDGFLRHLGIDLVARWEGRELSFLRRSVQCDYLRPIRYPQVVRIQVDVGELRARGVRYDFQFRVDDHLCAAGSIVAVCCLIGEGRVEPIAIPPPIRAKFEVHRKRTGSASPDGDGARV